MFPRHLRERIQAASGSRIELQGWVLFAAKSEQDAAAICATAMMAGRIIGQRRKAMTERNIEALADLGLQGGGALASTDSSNWT